MGQPPPEHSKGSAEDKCDIGLATARLFFEMSTAIPDAKLRQAVATMNDRMTLKRQYESVLIPDLEAEYQALSECWHRRDMPKLKTLLLAYFKRRRDLAPQIAQLINRPN